MVTVDSFLEYVVKEIETIIDSAYRIDEDWIKISAATYLYLSTQGSATLYETTTLQFSKHGHKGVIQNIILCTNMAYGIHCSVGKVRPFPYLWQNKF